MLDSPRVSFAAEGDMTALVQTLPGPPALPRPALPYELLPVPAGELAYRCFGRGSLAIINPLSYGITLDGLEEAHSRRLFLEGMGSGHRLICYDQRGSGGSAATRPPKDWEARAADVWSVADSLAIERAVLYGVFDAGHTVIRAALQEPDRVLGIILNFVPRDFAAAAPGHPDLARWFPAGVTEVEERTSELMLALGIDPDDARELAESFAATVSPENLVVLRNLVRTAALEQGLPAITAPALLLEPRRPLFHGWADDLFTVAPRGTVVHTARSLQALGAVHAFLGRIADEEGADASSVPPMVADAANAGETEVAHHRRIIVTVRNDASSARTVALACRLGQSQHAKIELVSVLELPYSLPIDAAPEEMTSAARRALRIGEAIARRNGLDCSSRVVAARRLSTALVKLAEETSASLVVIAADDSGEDETHLADTVREVLRRAHCEVLVDRGVTYGAR